MGIDPLTGLSKDVVKVCAEFCFSKGTKKVCQIHCGKDPPRTLLPWSFPLPPPSPPPPLPVEIHSGFNEKELFTNIALTVSCVLGGAIILGILLALLRECCYDSRRRRSSRRNPNPPVIFATQEQFIDGERVIDHPIWYINTVGLQQSVVDLISVIKYKKHEGLIEGTDCSVCLGEFLEDELLRLLPKCSHAFHISCIDTWLRSHKNCPLCRAPIVNESVVAQSDSVVTLGEENRVGDLESEVESRTIGAEEVNTSHENREDFPIEEKNIHAQNSGSLIEGLRVLSDLGNDQRVVDEDLQPVRRSVSLDSYADKNMAKVDPEQNESSSGIGSKQTSDDSSTRKLMKSSSVVVLGASSMQKEAISMKRVSSSGRFFFSSKSRRSQSSILPL
jgi:hypothetical protein